MPLPNKDSYEEGTSGLVTASQDNYIDLDMDKGTANQQVISCNVAMSGAATATVRFYDGTTAKPLTGELYYTAIPTNGFRLGRKYVSTGTLRIKVSGMGASGTAYYNVQYDYAR